MEGKSTNNFSSTSSISSLFDNLSNSTLAQLDARDVTVLNDVEAHQLSSHAPTSFRHVFDDTHDTDFDLNVPYVPPISNSDFQDGIFDRSHSPLPQNCASYGAKRKAPDGPSMDNEGNHGDILPDTSLQSIYPDGLTMSQELSSWRGDTSRVESNRLSGHPEHSYRNVLPRGRPETISRIQPPSDDRHLSATFFTHWSARTSVNMEGEISHSIQAETRTLISSQLVNRDQIRNSSNQGAGMTQNSGTTSSDNIILFGNVIGHSNRLHHHRNTGSDEASGEYITLFGNVIRRPNRPCPNNSTSSGGAIGRDSGRMVIDIDSVNESSGGFINDATEINQSIFMQHSWGNFYSSEFIAQTLTPSNAPVHMPYPPRAAFSSRAVHPDDTVESIHLPLADDIQGHLIGHAESQDEASNIDDDEEHDLDLISDLVSDEDNEDLLDEMPVNNQLSQEEIMQGLNPLKYQSTGGEQENCCICLDELGAGQDLVKLNCGHSYHFECIVQWLAKKNCCALCKRDAIQLDRD